MVSTLTQKQEFWLKVAHWVAAIGHIGSAIAIVAVSGGSAWSPSLELSHEYWVETPCLFNKSFDTSDECFQQARVVDTFGFSIIWVCFAFAAWSGIFHLVIYWTCLPQGSARRFAFPG